VVLLITSVDREAPKGSMILPESQTIRERTGKQLYHGSDERKRARRLSKPGHHTCTGNNRQLSLRQCGGKTSGKHSPDQLQHSFGRQRGNFEAFMEGTPHISMLEEGDSVLILESSHQTGCDDIGRVKIPQLLQQFTGKTLTFTFLSELSEPPQNVRQFSLVIQSNECMITRPQLMNRLKPFIKAGIPVTNYEMTTGLSGLGF